MARMAFKNLKGCDMSDMNAWANSVCGDNFMRELESRTAKMLNKLIKCGNEENAAAVREDKFHESLFAEARTSK